MYISCPFNPNFIYAKYFNPNKKVYSYNSMDFFFNAIFLICNDVQCDYDVDYQASVYSLKSQLDSFTMIYLEIY